MADQALIAPAPRPRIGNFPLRVATAAVGIPAIVGVVWTGGWLLAGVVAAAAGIAVFEIHMARGRPWTAFALLGAAGAALLPLSAELGFDDVPWALMLVAIVPVAALAFTREPKEGAVDWLWAAGPALYVGWLSAHFVLLRDVPDGRDWVLLSLLTVWITDTGAYFVGRPLGRHKMAPHISPGKTWEGTAGGEVAGFLAVAGLAMAFDLGLTAAQVVGLGLLVPTVGQIGDLAESSLKRGLGVKDSSGLVPGHGGVLDRLDSLLFAAPAVYWFLRWLVL
jgi:phosphatidate cytidylyltransferase